MGELVSVIVLVYNTEKYIERCIKSILGQTYTNIELILINDDSKEKEEEIILKYATVDSRIRYIKNEHNMGQYISRLKGVKQSTGKYIAFVDSDDYIGIDYIRLLVNSADKEQADIVFSKTVIEKVNAQKVINLYQDVELRKLPLKGDELSKAFYETEGMAYVWYVLWNKIYTKELWMKCMPWFEQMNTHLGMIEDMACAAILIYYADKAVMVENGVYYYCQRDGAATDCKYRNIDVYTKHIEDISTVFIFLAKFLSDKDDSYKQCLERFVAYYGRIWKRSIASLPLNCHEEANNLVSKICKNLDGYTDSRDQFFNTAQVDFDDRLDDIKKIIIESNAKYVSFDIFDTAVVRPFYTPSDIFYLLDKVYEETEDSVASFHDIRIDAEIACRQNISAESEKEDITLDNIYEYIGRVYGISEELCFRLKQEEQKLELRYCERRQTVYELYELAIWSGKKVIFTSDMYLDKELLANILKKNGYEDCAGIYVSSEYGKLKTTGNLYKVVLDSLGIKAGDVIHIGDNVRADIDAAETLGIQTIHIPRTLEVFEQKVMPKRDCASGYGSLVAMVANKYFDNPFRYFHPMTTYNMDPYFMGYYALGMNLISQLCWIEKSKNSNGRVVFTSRDGYMAYRACDIYNKYNDKKISAIYMQTSRRAMLPILLCSKADFMKLPMLYDKATPDGMLDLLSFCSGVVDKDELGSGYHIQWNKVFADRAEYHKFMDIYMDCIYDHGAHMESAEVVKAYWKDISNEDAIYDVGYTGSMHYALVKAIGKKPQAMYMHTDRDKYQIMSRKGQFDINSFMDEIPNVSSILREYIFSSTEGSCVGYNVKGATVEPIINNVEHDYCDIWSLNIMQEAALEMVEAFYARFTDYIQYLAIRPKELQQPLEELLTVSTKLDTKVFTASYFDDKIPGTNNRLGVRDYWLQVLLKTPGGNADVLGNVREFLDERGKNKLAFWGTGQICQDILNANKVHVDVFFDNDLDKNGTSWREGIIYHPTSVKDISQYYIVIACGAYVQVEEQLQAMGLQKYKDYVSYIDMF